MVVIIEIWVVLVNGCLFINISQNMCLSFRIWPPSPIVDTFQCQGEMTTRVQQRDYCGFSTEYVDSPFLACIRSGRVDFFEAVGSCEYDVCEDHLNVTANDFMLIPDCLNTGVCHIDFAGSKDVACEAILAVADSCEGAGFSVAGWRTYFRCRKNSELLL